MTGVPELSGHRCNNNHGRTSANAFHPDRRLNLNSEFGGSACGNELDVERQPSFPRTPS
jgi:hypothetical protein